MPGTEPPAPPPVPGEQTAAPGGSVGVVSRAPEEQITPHRLCVVLLVREYCQYKEQVPTILPAERSAVCLLVLSLVQSPDLDLSSTCERMEARLPPGLVTNWATGVSRLQEEGVAGLMDLVQSTEKLLAADCEPPVNRSSVLGLMLRRVCLSFDKLTFSEVSALRQQVDNFHRAGRAALVRLLDRPGDSTEQEMSLECEESGLENLRLGASLLPPEAGSAWENSISAPPSVSRKQADLLLAQQASLLQTAECAALPPKELQQEITRVLTSCPGLPEAHFLSYLNCLRVREIVGATHSLYSHYAHFNQNLWEPQQTPVKPGTTVPDESNKGFRYAALNLAAFHSRLDQREEALAAIREAITLAQEASDHTCLQHVLNLLYRTVRPEEKTRLMERCIGKCGELSLSYLSSLGIQAFSQHVSDTTSSPGEVLELLTRSDVLNCQHSIAELQAMSFMCKAAVWTQYGRPGLACTLSQLLLQLNTADPARAGHNYSGEPTVIALSNVALNLETRGFSGQADLVLDTAKSLFPSTRSQLCRVWQAARSRLSLWRALARLDWTKAALAVERLEAANMPDSSLLRAELYFKQGRVVEARELVQSILQAGGRGEKVELRVRSLLLLADIHCWSSDPAGAVEHLVRATDLASSRRLELLQLLARMQLSHCQLLLDCPQQALLLATSCLAPLLAHASMQDQARAWLLAAKCKISASRGSSPAVRRTELLEGAVMITRAKEGFNVAGDFARVKDCLYLLARLYHGLQLAKERNMAAQHYKKLDDIYPVKTRVLLDCLL